MQRFGFLRRTGSGVGGDDDASDAVDAKHGSPHKSRGSTSSTAGVGSDHADDGSSDSGSDDSRATTVVKHSHNHSISSQHSVGDYPEWLHRDERDPRGSSSSTAGTHTVFPGPPAGPLHRVDSRTHINEALHTRMDTMKKPAQKKMIRFEKSDDSIASMNRWAHKRWWKMTMVTLTMMP